MGFGLKRKDLPGLDTKQAAFVIEYFKDYNPRDAAERSGHDPDDGYKLMKDPVIEEAIHEVIQEALDDVHMDAQMLLQELIINHRLARQKGNLSASNKALELIAKHVSVDAMAKTKLEVDVVSDEKIMERLQRGRVRSRLVAMGVPDTPSEEVTFI